MAAAELPVAWPVIRCVKCGQLVPSAVYPSDDPAVSGTDESDLDDGDLTPDCRQCLLLCRQTLTQRTQRGLCPRCHLVRPGVKVYDAKEHDYAYDWCWCHDCTAESFSGGH